MRIYSVPADVNEKEKIIGGLFTWTQFFWMLGGGGVGAIVFVATSQIVPAKVSIVLGLLSTLICVPFVFFKKNDLSFFEYQLRKKNFQKIKKKLFIRR